MLVISDGTDRDGDGQAGIEPTEIVTVRYFEVEHDELLNPERKTATLYKTGVCKAREPPMVTPIAACAMTPIWGSTSTYPGPSNYASYQLLEVASVSTTHNGRFARDRPVLSIQCGR